MKVTEYIQYRDEEEIVKAIREYDDLGNLVKDIEFEEGKQASKLEMEYDAEQRIIKTSQYKTDDEWIDTKETTYADGKISQSIIHYPDGSQTIETYKRTADSLEIISEDEDGEFEGAIFRHLKNGLTTELTCTNFMRKKISHLKYEYDEKQQVSKILELNPKGKIEKIYAYKYDDLGNQICEDELDRKEQLKSHIIHRFEENRLIESQSPNQLKKIEYYNNLPVKEILINPDDSTDISIIQYNSEEKKIKEKIYKIPQGETFDELYLELTKRTEYSK